MRGTAEPESRRPPPTTAKDPSAVSPGEPSEAARRPGVPFGEEAGTARAPAGITRAPATSPGEAAETVPPAASGAVAPAATKPSADGSRAHAPTIRAPRATNQAHAATTQAPGAPTEGRLAGWGNLAVPGREVRSEDLREVARSAPLTRGLGRSYGDSSLPAPGDSTVAGSILADRILAFDPDTGVLRAEAGFTLQEMNRIFLPRGWFTPVSPGTKFVTLGGMVASDVHGKNHHRRGTFGAHVRALRMCVADGRIVECSPTLHPDLFHATIGGMGLTGHILEVECVLERVPSPWIVMESRRVTDIDHLLHELDGFGRHWPFTMAWVDCVSRGASMGRGIVMAGRWAEADEAPIHPPAERRKLSVPFMFPSWALNRWTVRLFNELYYRSHPQRQQPHVVHPDKFFYPLDAIHGWNRVYGRRGFTQYQCVLPDVGGAPEEGSATARGVDGARPRDAGDAGAHGAGLDAGDAAGAGHGVAPTHALASVPARPRATRQAVRAFMDLLTRSGAASPLCVVKDCGDEGAGLLSFPKRGVSIAADFAITPRTQALVDALNELVIAHGGRVYLTKDAFTRREHFHAMEPRLEAWRAVRRRWDPEGRLRSRQSVRLLDGPT